MLQGRTKNKAKKYKLGEHPNSQANLNREGRPKTYNAEKKQRYLSITEEGWEGAQSAVKAAGLKSISELIEKLGRNQIVLIDDALVDVRGQEIYPPKDSLLISSLEAQVDELKDKLSAVQRIVGKISAA